MTSPHHAPDRAQPAQRERVSEADEAEDGVAALQKLRSSRFDFVVTDINMPNMNGFRLLAEVKSDENRTPARADR